MAARKRKERSPHELVAEEAKEIKALMNEGRVLLEKAATDDEVRAALNVFDRTIAKVSLNSQVPHLSQL